MSTSQRWLSLLGVCILLLAFVIPYHFPLWDVYAAQLLRTHLLFIGALLLTLLFLLLWKYPQWEVAAVRDRKDRIDLASKSRQTLAQIVGGAVLLVGLYFTAQTLRTTQEGQITDRFTKAIDQLGKDTLAVRLGGIYALERIARDSEYDHWAVMEVLTAFVREQTQGRLDTSRSWVAILFSKEREMAKLPADIQAILTVIGRRTRTFGNGETKRLNLNNTDLRGADLREAQLQGADLREAQLQGADLAKAQLQGADLDEAQLEKAILTGARLQHARLKGAQLQHARLTGAQLQGASLISAQLEKAILYGAQLQGASLTRAQLREANLRFAELREARLREAQLQGVDLRTTKNLTQEQINWACIDENTQLPEGLTKPPPCPANP